MHYIEKTFDRLNCIKARRLINVNAFYGKISVSEIACAEGMLACMSMHMDAADAGRAHDTQERALEQNEEDFPSLVARQMKCQNFTLLQFIVEKNDQADDNEQTSACLLSSWVALLAEI